MTASAVFFGVKKGQRMDASMADILLPTLIALIAFPACVLGLSIFIQTQVPKSDVTILPVAQVMMMFGWSVLISWIGVVPVYFIAKVAVKRGWIGLMHTLVFGACIPVIAVFVFRSFYYLLQPSEGFDFPNILGLATVSALVGMAFAFVAWLTFYIRRRDFYCTAPD